MGLFVGQSPSLLIENLWGCRRSQRPRRPVLCRTPCPLLPFFLHQGHYYFACRNAINIGNGGHNPGRKRRRVSSASDCLTSHERQASHERLHNDLAGRCGIWGVSRASHERLASVSQRSLLTSVCTMISPVAAPYGASHDSRASAQCRGIRASLTSDSRASDEMTSPVAAAAYGHSVSRASHERRTSHGRRTSHV